MDGDGFSVLSKTQLPQLQEKLKNMFPLSLKVFGSTKSILSGNLGRELVVNRWPNFTVLLDKPIPEKCPEYIDNVYTLLTTSEGESELAEFLSRPGVVDWQKMPIVIGGCPISAGKAVTDAAEKNGHKVRVSADSACHMYCLKDDHTPCQLDLPAGYILGSVKPEEAALVASQWSYSAKGALPFVRFLLEKYPSVAIRDASTGDLIGYYLQQWFYALGMLFVAEEHRGKGLGKILVAEMAQRVLKNGDPQAFCYVEYSNEVSSTLHEKCGFQKVEGGDVNWLTILAPGACCSAKCCV